MEFTEENSQILEVLNPGEAVQHTYEQITAHPDQKDILIAQLTKHFFDSKPTEQQVRKSYSHTTFNLAEILNGYETRLDEANAKLEKDNQDPKTLEAVHTLAQEMKDIITRYRTAAKPLDIYSLATFGKTPKEMFLQQLAS